LKADLGLPDYAALFREQAIDADVLPSLTDADFEKLGLPLAHRKKLLTAGSNRRHQNATPPKRNDRSAGAGQ
jgi:hypothetical protein